MENSKRDIEDIFTRSFISRTI